MFSKVHTEKAALKSNTKSCLSLVQYLGKENDGVDLLNREFFFNDNSDVITDNKVVQLLDNNKKGLGKDDYKFFMVTVNPSQNELQHLAKLATGKDITDVSKMTKAELKEYNILFKSYVNRVMDDYAAAFNRKGADLTRKDLLYFGKVEQQRKWKGTDKPVREKIPIKGKVVKSGELKEGFQTHAHVIVSRKTKDMSMKISPNAVSRGYSEKHTLNGKKVNVGFDNVKFKIEAENTFDRSFGYDRLNKDKAFQKMINKNKPELNLKYSAYSTYQKLNKVELLINPQKLQMHAAKKLIGNSKELKNVFQKTVLSQTMLRPALAPNMILSKLANLNPTTAIINKGLRIAKIPAKIIFKGMDI
jgi:Family of unknown function (DUF5712)